jgi:hypothetical protein
MIETLQAVLTILIAAGVKYVFQLLKVEIDGKTFNAIVAAVVTALLALAGVSVAQSQGLL